MMFPRTLISTELEFIRWLLPEHSPVYTATLHQIESGIVLGEGRWGSGDLMVGDPKTPIDLTLGMTPIIAYGECVIGDQKMTISIHQSNIDEQIEIQFAGSYPLPENPQVTSGWTYSYWKPGMSDPESNTALREVSITDTSGNIRYTLVFSPTRKALWVYHNHTFFTELLPVTGFMDELLRTHGIREIERISQPTQVFETLDEFTDGDIVRAFLEYVPVSMRKLDIANLVIPERKERRSVFAKLLKKS